MNKLVLCLIAAAAFTACTDDEESLANGGSVDTSVMPASKPNDVVNQNLFDKLNLDYPGLEKVKAYHEADQDYYACYELLKYYRTRTNVTNLNINLINPSVTASEQNIADKAVEYKFYVRNFDKYLDDANYTFLKDKAIDWTYVPADVTDQEFKSQIHRHQWMLPQAKAYRVTGDEKYVKSWMEVYGNWLETFPCPEVVTNDKEPQWYGLQPAERVLSQVDILPYFIQSTNFTPEWLSTFLNAFADEVEAVRKGYFTDGSNIYLTQTQAVFTAGVLMPEFKNAEEWVNEGAQKIGAQVSDQFLADGVQNELDPSYHIGAVDDFYSIYKLAKANDKLGLFPSDYVTKLEKAARFVTDIIYPNYSIDNFNDTRSSSYSKSVIIKNLKKYAEMFPENKEFQWMATEGKQGTMPTSLTAAYDASGYYMLRSGWTANSTMMILKNNNNSENKWHCQPDNGTFGLYRNGRNFTPDAGVYSYGGTSSSNADRTAFAATKMHNTMTRNSKDIASGFMNGKLLKLETVGNTDILVTENQSYSDMAHRRAVFFVDKTFFVLVDEAHGDGTETYNANLNFNLCPAKDDVTIDEANVDNHIYGAHTAFADNNNMLFKTFVETTGGYKVENNTGYISEKLGEKTYQRRNYKVTIQKAVGKAARFITVIYPFGAPADFASQNITAQFTDNTEGEEGTFHAEGASVKVTVNGKDYELSYTL